MQASPQYLLVFLLGQFTVKTYTIDITIISVHCFIFIYYNIKKVSLIKSIRCVNREDTINVSILFFNFLEFCDKFTQRHFLHSPQILQPIQPYRPIYHILRLLEMNHSNRLFQVCHPYR